MMIMKCNERNNEKWYMMMVKVYDDNDNDNM